jgi:hypothetical protein
MTRIDCRPRTSSSGRSLGGCLWEWAYCDSGWGQNALRETEDSLSNYTRGLAIAVSGLSEFGVGVA